ncbi:PaaX family transcriptional regulator C-terminal domain-containing protein [Aliihoeflea sp. 2WW]|uniref:PaaX family transcriptional regulator n=1 Tax=Aliihoeflea sp. 2WW TaxID=1381123 RepID=UPI000464521D|nr:PaaX family transcriptional regulator C-terminal domain-containing protein [Aliihoeflea sp. 2WW]
MALHHNPAQKALDGLIDRLHAKGRIRVWSLVITMFGDAVVPRGGQVPLGVLQDVMGRLRIEAGALRTAMSRLASDHWVIREREGRNSNYRLAEEGRHAFDLATRRIYSEGPPAWTGAWTVAIAPPNGDSDILADATGLGFVRINGGVYLRPETEGAIRLDDALAGALIVHGESAEHPEAFHELWPSRDIAEAYRALIATLTPLQSAFQAGARLSGLDAMAARILLIHNWRRIVLRDPGLPIDLLPADWPGEDARSLVRHLYNALHEASEDWLDHAGLPSPHAPQRFAGLASAAAPQDLVS